MDAAAHYRAYLVAEPADFAIWVQLGHMLGEVGDFLGAESAYAMAESLRADDADMLLCWGHLRRRSGDLAGCAELYRRSLALELRDDTQTCLAEVEQILAELDPPLRETVDEQVDELPIEQEAVEEIPPPPPPLPLAGVIEFAEDRTIAGWATLGEGVDQDDVIFEINDETIGHSALIHGRGDGSFRFRSLLNIDGHASVTVRRRSDGRELANSPVAMNWSPAAPHQDPPAWSVPIEIVKPLSTEMEDLAVLVTHTATGLIKPHVLPYIRALRAEGIEVLLVVVVDRPIDLSDDLLDAVAGVVVRANAGFDFAAWSHALKLYPELYGSGTLYLLNDSMFGPPDGDAFAAAIARVRGNNADLIGLTESYEHGWHVQSYFLALRPRLTGSVHLQAFFENVRILADKDAVIRAYEVPFAAMVRAIGMRVEVLFSSPLAVNPALFGWRALLAAGFPFVKVLLLRGFFPEADLSDWRGEMARAGFDISLLELTIRAASEVLPQGGAPGLVAKSRSAAEIGQPLKVAFFGPWNYDSGLASASRGMVAALRRTGVRLNLHPIRVPFHIHKPFAPPVDVLDFDGPADIAVVHLNPDSWHLLTDNQRATIGAAHKRIGLWVWEMGHIPAAWWTNFRSVDRIWAPSSYCAELFADHADVPVDVIPHAVPVPPPAEETIDRAKLLPDVLPSDRILLYAFDGASYLIRKNPESLVRGFAASGLAGRGWKLVLKTKHLMDRPADGAAFRTLTESVEGVVLIDRPMAAAEFHALLQAADVYASTHCSEGFGLTIAEAMAVGKPVVATDFGGSRDFLDVSSGYPVKAHEWTLEQDFNHYTVGGSWGRIDEPALAATLVEAADAVEAGDTRIGAAARDRIARQLSFEAIGEKIAASFAGVLGMKSSHAAPAGFQRIHAGVTAGMPLDRADYGPRFQVLALDDHGAIDPSKSLPDAAFLRETDHWVVISPRDGRLHPLLNRLVEDRARTRPDVSIFYGDDFANQTDEPIDQLRLKPAFDVTLLTAQDYIGAPLIVRANVFATLGGLRSEAGTAATLDLLLRAHGQGLSIERITEVLLAFPGERARPTLEDHVAALKMQAFLADYQILPEAERKDVALRRRFDGDHPAVTLVIPTCRTPLRDGAGTYVERLLGQIAQTQWPPDKLHVLIGDDVGGVPSWAARNWPFRLTRIKTPRADGERFNYSRKMNQLWRLAETEHLVFLNDDILPAHADWLEALMTFSVDEGVGGVGAKLFFEDGRLQHVGIVPHNLSIVHAWLWHDGTRPTYQGWADVQREWSMITGAVFATRKAVLAEVDGFDEAFALEYNDVDLCLRIRALGYRIIATPGAEMIHVEKASRGEEGPPGSEPARFLRRWRAWLAEDPAWHPQMRGDSIDPLPTIDPHAWYMP